MIKLDNNQKFNFFACGEKTSKKSFGWDNIALFSVITSVGVSLISNLLNISCSIKQKAPTIQTTKVFGTTSNLKTNFF